MINREEVGREIKELLQDHADITNDIRITVQRPNEADVYIDGKLFNTYLIEKKRFANNIVLVKKKKPDFKMNVVISRDDLAEAYSQYRGAELQLPATSNEIKDVLERARISSKREKYTVTECLFYDYDLVNDFKKQDLELESLNYLAKVLSRLDKHEHVLFRGLAEQKGTMSLSVRDLINIAYNLQDCEIIYELEDDEQLALFCIDDGRVDWLLDADKRVWEYLDYELLGKDIREREGGIYTKDGYFVCNGNGFNEVYDGVTFPEEFGEDEYMFKVLIARKDSLKKDADTWLSLPASKEDTVRFLNKIGAESLDDCILMATQSMESAIPMCIKDLSHFDMLNSLAFKMRELDRTGDLAKFKAVLAAFGCESLDAAMAYINDLKRYEIYPEASSLIEYAKEVFRKKYKGVLPESLVNHFNFATFAEELTKEEKIGCSEYGIVKYIDAGAKQIAMKI